MHVHWNVGMKDITYTTRNFLQPLPTFSPPLLNRVNLRFWKFRRFLGAHFRYFKEWEKLIFVFTLLPIYDVRIYVSIQTEFSIIPQPITNTRRQNYLHKYDQYFMIDQLISKDDFRRRRRGVGGGCTRHGSTFPPARSVACPHSSPAGPCAKRLLHWGGSTGEPLIYELVCQPHW